MLYHHPSYVPPKKILQRYAQVLVNFALGNDEGIQPGEVVQVILPDIAKPLGLELQNEILKAGGHVLMKMIPTGFEADYYHLANKNQLTFFPKVYWRERAALIDHSIGIIADPNPEALAKVDPKKIMLARDSKKTYRDWLMQKENQGKFTWTLALWGTTAKAKIVGLSLKDYWQQIIHACFLDEADPIAQWRQIKKMQAETKKKLNRLRIDFVHIKGADVDLKIKLGANRIWQGGADRNIPSFELFTSPDWRGTEGWIKFNQPLFRYGNVIEGVTLTFHHGLVTQAHAKKGQALLDAMLQSPHANRLGEFSLTDKRTSRINHFMAETLYDENVGGPFGNTHVAIGMAYKDCYRGDPNQPTKQIWEKMGFNDSPEHTDIVSTTNRKVTAHLTNGAEKVIYQNGMFVL